MKTHVDFETSLRNILITNTKFKRRIRKFWGTEVISGPEGNVEVLKKRFYLKPNLDEKDTEVILKLFGITEEIENSDFSDLEEAWLYMNPRKHDSTSIIDADILATQINTQIPLNESITFTINITDPSDPNKFLNWTNQQIANYVLADYDTIFKELFYTSNGVTALEDVLGLYILLDDGTYFNREIIKAVVTAIPTGEDYTEYSNASLPFIQMYTTGIAVTIKATRIADVDPLSNFITTILEENQEYHNVMLNEISNWEDSGIPTEYVTYEPFIGYYQNDTIWYQDQLRMAVFDSTYMDRDLFMDLIANSLDIGYKEDKGSFLEQLLAFVVLAIAVYLIPFTGGNSIYLFMGYLGTLTVVLIGIQLLFKELGVMGITYMFGKFIQAIGIMSIMLTVFTGVSAIASKGISILTSSFSSAAKIVGMGFDFVQKLKVKQFNSRVASLEEEITEQEDELARLTDTELHLGIENIKFYTKTLDSDNIQFETDYLYEGTVMNVGRPSFRPYGLNQRSKLKKYKA